MSPPAQVMPQEESVLCVPATNTLFCVLQEASVTVHGWQACPPVENVPEVHPWQEPIALSTKPSCTQEHTALVNTPALEQAGPETFRKLLLHSYEQVAFSPICVPQSVPLVPAVMLGKLCETGGSTAQVVPE